MASFLRLSSRKARALEGHPWVFANEVAKAPAASWDGQGMELRDGQGRSLGSGIVNGHSQILWRRYSRQVRPFDVDFLREALVAALARRNANPVQRLVWSEADAIPGLVVDRYHEVLVLQALTRAVDQRIELIADLLRESIPALREVVFRNDAPSREKEGLAKTTRTASGAELGAEWHEIDGIRYRLDLLHAHKTGFYLDQRREHLRVGALAAGRSVLDAFCNSGAFALQAAKNGAASVTAIDSVPDCIGQLEANATANGLEVNAVCANVFDWFHANRAARFDLIVLDPPSFAPNRKALEGALRGYKEINLRAFQALNPGGVLATYSCSQVVSAAQLAETVRQAAADARRDVHVLASASQPLDHPVLLNFPESHYLNGLILEAK